MKRTSFVYLALVLVMVATLLAPLSAMAEEPTEEYVFVAYVTSIPFWTDPVAGFMAACEHLGVKGSFTGPIEFDAHHR